MSRSLQGKYLSECHGESRDCCGGGATFLFSSFSLSERRAADIKGKNDFSASGYFTKSFVSAVFSVIALAWVFAF